MALNKQCLNKTFDPATWEVTAEQIMKYAVGYNEDKPEFTDVSKPDKMMAPPMFGVTYSGGPIGQAFFDPEFNVNFGRLLHGEQDMTFYRLVRPGDQLTSVGKIISVEDKGSGEFFEVEVLTKDAKGELVQKLIGGFFIRGSKKNPGDNKGGQAPKPAEEPRGEIAFSQSMKVKEDQTYIYADGSGDHNPIHVDPDFAKSVGLPGIILQGLCSMAFASKAVYDELSGGDASKLHRIKVRFKQPVLPGDVVTTEGWKIEKKGDVTVYGFEVKNHKGDKVITNGVAEVK